MCVYIYFNYIGSTRSQGLRRTWGGKYLRYPYSNARVVEGIGLGYPHSLLSRLFITAVPIISRRGG
jgi:hypothetical protein